MRSIFWTSCGTDGFLVRQVAKRELYPVNADSASLSLMGDWCSKADTASNENSRCGEEMVADYRKRKKTLFTSGLLRALDRVAFNG
ncbi:MAG TPA: hypothetical protein VN328_11720 [Thermodesulfovibrionales bacterium]|nr:hypothetical protein [Thermodesulfovibrionales bacterium]